MTNHSRIHLAAFAIGMIAACVELRPNPAHCANQQGDASCAERFPDGELPYCGMLDCADAQWGCLAAPPSDPACYSPCGGGAGASEDMSCLGVADESTDTTDTTPECTSDIECGAELFCVEGSCTDCAGTPMPDAACASASAGALPVCDAGVCVECTPESSAACTGSTPVCEADSSTCTGCDFHAQCSASACRVLEGSCLPEARVWHVDGDGGADFTTITQALLQIGIGEQGTLIIHEREGDAAYVEPLVIGESRVIALVAAPGEHPRLVNDVGTTLQIESGAEVYLQGLTLAGITPLQVEGGASLVLDEVEVTGQVEAAVLVLADALLFARNSIIVSSASDAFFGPAIAVDMARIELVYTTVIGRTNNPAISCGMGTAGSSIRNGLIANESLTPAIECSELTLLHVALEDATPQPDNTMLGELDPTWFEVGTNYRIGPDAPPALASAALRLAGDPPLDIDGATRPAVDQPDGGGADLGPR
jgi:hypothetical protein